MKWEFKWNQNYEEIGASRTRTYVYVAYPNLTSINHASIRYLPAVNRS